ncbi:MAG TPA: F0F1 ATP synthase subunit A, partial [Candidatus Paceibacterota bacterium]|nr:F0F1 ATP synthase subunit A [Candidatus Paceibacterota bacterium]
DNFNFMDVPEISIAAEKLFDVFGFPITNTFLLTLIIGLCVVLLSFFAFKKKKIIPDSLQNFFEWAFEALLGYVDSITNDRKKTLKIFPLTAVIFIIVLLSNLLEILPGIGVFNFLRSPSSDLNFTLALAVFSMVSVHILSLQDLGFSNYIKKYISKNPIFLFVGLLEGMGELTRTFSLAIRLFGNLLAGEVLLMIVSFMLAYVFPLPFLALEIFVGFIQALIFSSLIIIFYVVTSEKPEQR